VGIKGKIIIETASLLNKRSFYYLLTSSVTKNVKCVEHKNDIGQLTNHE